MRVSVAVLLGIVLLFAGLTAVSESAQQSRDAAVTNGTNATGDAYNMTRDTYGGITKAGSGAIVYMGIAAFILVALGYLVAAGNSGR